MKLLRGGGRAVEARVAEGILFAGKTGLGSTMIALMHISDLHIADTVRWVGTFHARQANRQPYYPPHFRGHDERVAQDLTTDWLALRQRHPGAWLLVSGDLTRLGKGTEFGLAHRFVHARWWLDPTPPLLGLRGGGDRTLTIPGNHDFWNGNVMNPMMNWGALEPHFVPLPWFAPIAVDQWDLEVHVVGLDSCSGLWLVSPNQVRALGAIHKRQLTVAAQKLNDELNVARDRGRKVLRVVMVHHPPEKLTAASRAAFEAWLKANRVSVLLTGHTHEHSYPGKPVPGQPPPLVPPAPPAPPYELRCGTTLQAGTDDRMPGKEPNHYYLHRLTPGRNEGVIEWRTSGFAHNGQRWAPLVNPLWTGQLRVLA